MSASGSDSFGVKPFRGEPVLAESFADLLGAYARAGEVSDALASRKPGSDCRFGVAREFPERTSGRGAAAATVTRGTAARDGSGSAPDQPGALGANTSPIKLEAKTSPIKRSWKGADGCEDCDDPPGAAWSNENRSPNGKRTNGGAVRLSGSLNANSESSPRLAKCARSTGAPPSSLMYD